MKIPNLPILVLDTETTGFVPVVHRVIEYACAIAKDGKLVKEYEQLLSSETNDVPAMVQVLTQIRPSDLEGKPTFADALAIIESMLSPEMIVVGQNINFDLRMLKGEGWDITDVPWIDTAMLASVVFPELKSYSLGFVSEALDLNHEPKHRALGDVRATMELFCLCCERLESLPGKDLDALKAIAAKGPESYRRLFESLESSAKNKKPDWLKLSRHSDPAASDLSVPASPIAIPALGTVQLIEESLLPATLNSVLAGSKKGTIVAVKNLDATLRRIEISEDIVVLTSPDALISKEASDQFIKQEKFTADEMTLAMKLTLYGATTKNDIPIHGDEYAIWTAKLAANSESPEYRSRFLQIGKSTVLTSHHELIALANADQPVISEKTPVIIDDASMLEDTATGALGWTCLITTLRAAAAQQEHLTKCVDLIELWTEKIRDGQDLRYLAPSDLESNDAEYLRGIVADLLKTKLENGPKRALTDFLLILNPENLNNRITWIESFMDGNKAIKSVPEKIADVLGELLYTVSPTTLLIAKGSITEQSAIVPATVTTSAGSLAVLPSPAITISTPVGTTIDQQLSTVTGKRIILLGSKRAIEDLYVKHAERCEKEGIAFLCQGFSGGQSRMQAEFALAKEPAVMVTTPWMFETMEIPAETVSLLVLQLLPFDHPSHAVFSRRANRYRDPFSEYSLPRVKQRLFRLARTFCKHAKKAAEMLVLDDRLRTKPYGKIVAQYLLSLAPTAAKDSKGSEEGQMTLL